jgi:hypothetical protein
MAEHAFFFAEGLVDEWFGEFLVHFCLVAFETLGIGGRWRQALLSRAGGCGIQGQASYG